MEHFRVLPTDKRFKELNDLQMELLLVNFLNTPDDATLKQTYYKSKKKEAKLEGLPVHILKNMGYTDADIEKLKKDLIGNT